MLINIIGIYSMMLQQINQEPQDQFYELDGTSKHPIGIVSLVCCNKCLILIPLENSYNKLSTSELLFLSCSSFFVGFFVCRVFIKSCFVVTVAA
jgi:hypothetical protein